MSRLASQPLQQSKTEHSNSCPCVELPVHSAAVIPVRNRPSLIVEAIASVQRQTRPLDEIIVVDDGSTDNTPEVVTRLSQQDGRLRLIRLPASGGASAARNVGVNASRCSWICFLDSDDQWLDKKHEMQCRELSNTPGAIASFTGIIHQWRRRRFDARASAQVTLQSLRRLNYIGSTSTAMVRRDMLEQIGGFDATLPSCQDWDLWIKLCRAGEFAVVPEPLVIFNQEERSRISRDRAAVLAGHAQLFAKALEDVSDSRERRAIAAHHQIRLTQIYLWDFEQPGLAIIAALRSLALHPTHYAAELLIKRVPRKIAGQLLGRGRLGRLPTLTKAAEATQQLSGAVAAASRQASADVQSIATAAEEMASTEITRQVRETAQLLPKP